MVKQYFLRFCFTNSMTNSLSSYDFNNFVNKTSKIKTPAPNLSSNVQNNVSKNAPAEEKRQIKRPEVGVVDAPFITTMPIQDAIDIKKTENPYTKYKQTFERYDKINLQTAASVLVGACGIFSLISLLKKSR